MVTGKLNSKQREESVNWIFPNWQPPFASSINIEDNSRVIVFAEMDGGSCSSGKFKLYEQLELQEFQDKFVIKSVEAPDQGFSIDRRDGTIEPLNGDSSSSSSSSARPTKTSTIYGVAGTIRLLAGNFVLVITSRTEVGAFLGFPFYRVTSMKFLSCNEKKDEAYFMALLKKSNQHQGCTFLTKQILH